MNNRQRALWVMCTLAVFLTDPAAAQVVILHKLDGMPLRVDANKIEIFTHTASCKHAGAVVTAGGQKVCVKETLDQICTIIAPFKKCEAENR